MKVAFPPAACAGSVLWGWQCHSSKLSFVSALCSPEVSEKCPPTMTQLLPPPALCQAGPGLRPTLQSSVLPGVPCWVCASCHIPLASSSCLPAEVCPFRWLSQDDHVPQLSCAAPGSHVAAPVSLLHVQGCVWAHRAWKDRGGARVGVLWGCPTPLPTAMCCWQAQAQPRWFSAAPLSLPIQGSSHLTSLPGTSISTARKILPGRCHHSQDGNHSELLPRQERCLVDK